MKSVTRFGGPVLEILQPGLVIFLGKRAEEWLVEHWPRLKSHMRHGTVNKLQQSEEKPIDWIAFRSHRMEQPAPKFAQSSPVAFEDAAAQQLRLNDI